MIAVLKMAGPDADNHRKILTSSRCIERWIKPHVKAFIFMCLKLVEAAGVEPARAIDKMQVADFTNRLNRQNHQNR